MGNEFIFEGKKYISAIRVSKIYGYNSDYIGQLCRKNILDCRRVGRVWFVEENSLNAHKVAASQVVRGRIPFVKNPVVEKKYVSISKASKMYGYNSDYIGQLCRKNILDCRRVGRVWFVEEESIKNHKTIVSQTPRGRIAFPKKNSDFIFVQNNETQFSKDDVSTSNPTNFLAFKSELSVGDEFIEKNIEQKQNKFFVQKLLVGAAMVLILVIATPFFIYSRGGPVADLSPSIAKSFVGQKFSNIAAEIKNYKAQTVDSVAYSANASYSSGDSFGEKFYRVVQGLGDRLTYATDFFRYTTNKFKLAFSGSEIDGKGVGRDRIGVAVVPSAHDDVINQQVKEYVTNSFSDETEIVPDESGNSGVIKPVFKDESDQEYIYVIVPVKE